MDEEANVTATTTTDQAGDMTSATATSTVISDLTSDEAMQLSTSIEAASAPNTTEIENVVASEIVEPITSSEQIESVAVEGTVEDQQPIEIDPSIMETTNNLIEQIEKGGGIDAGGGGGSTMEVVEDNGTSFAELTNVGQANIVEHHPQDGQVATISIDPNNPDNVMLLLSSENGVSASAGGEAVAIEAQQITNSAGAANDSGAGLGDDDSTLHEDDLGLNEDNSLKGMLQ